MIPSWIWNILAHMKHEHGFIIIGAGDWGQLPAVKEDHIDFEICRRAVKEFTVVLVPMIMGNNLLEDSDFF